jgi:hypothetical protein
MLWLSRNKNKLVEQQTYKKKLQLVQTCVRLLPAMKVVPLTHLHPFLPSSVASVASPLLLLPPQAAAAHPPPAFLARL